MDSFLIYGATGYTGRLIVRAAVERGMRPILGGRNPDKLKEVAGPFGLDWRRIALDEAGDLNAGLSGIRAVLSAAGPFSRTARPLVDACLRARVSYLDITGEIDVLEELAARHAEAQAAGIVLLPAVGFDVVPSDCLAAHLKGRLPGAVRLWIGIAGLTRASRGTALTGIEMLAGGIRVRRQGRVVVLAKPLERQVDFGRGPEPAVSVTWGDVATAFRSTAIPDITVYFRANPQIRLFAAPGPALRRLLTTRPFRALLRRAVALLPVGPNAAELASGGAVLVGEAEDGRGTTARARLETPEPYALTALTSVEAAARVLAGEVGPGFQTPATAFGADFILRFAGTRRSDL